MTFYSIPNTRRFLERVRTCGGEVRYLGRDGRALDLKAAAVALTDNGLDRFLGPIDKIEVFTQCAEVQSHKPSIRQALIPVKPITLSSRDLASSIDLIIFFELPEVEIATNTSPCTP